ncbi:MAG: hypothetical protein LQ338_007611 [Usnochroma carphineum]|nr:MAG: hypothetical protein LQ338_007611 [Usnochroma carphineum]
MEADAEFTKRLPKVELHAHLTGSITRECLHNIWLERKNEEPDFSLADPLESLPSGEADYDINTFFPLFNSYIYNLIITIPSVIHSTNAVLNDFFADGICYLELRTTPRASSGFTREQYITTILACIANHNRRQTAMHTYLILSVDRKHNAQEVAEIVDLAIKLQDRGIVGVDLCGNPAHPIDVNMLHREYRRAKKVGLGLTLHFAEIEASASRAELLGLLAMQPDRLGHVIHADKDIKGEIAKRKIGLELCLSCNVHAKLTTGGFQEHHFGEWYRRKDRGAVVLCIS